MTKVKPPYFDPYIYRKVWEDSWLPPISKEILEPRSVSLKHKFLFSGFKERAKEFFEKEQKFIEEMVQEEIAYQFEYLQDYIGFNEEEKQRWFKQLREDFNLPDDYNFE